MCQEICQGLHMCDQNAPALVGVYYYFYFITELGRVLSLGLYNILIFLTYHFLGHKVCACVLSRFSRV